VAVTTLVISPHLDDAVLSLGGAIAGWAEAGPVVIASVYTTGPPLQAVPRSMRTFADYPARRSEDAAACATVGAETRWLDRVERAFRRPFLTGTQFFTTPPRRDGLTELAAVSSVLTPLLSPPPTRIAVPFGIGNHVDHVETLVAATDLILARGLADRVVFYEDFYALSGPMRRAHWVAAGRRWRPWQAPLLRARRLAVILGAIAASRRGPPVEALLAPAWRSATWRVEPIALAAHHAAAKLAAIACYRSQTRAFGGKAGIERALRAYHAWWGGAEPVWRPALRS
jgi:LmbE family N-acetylglucosaminyl deacetylase